MRPLISYDRCKVLFAQRFFDTNQLVVFSNTVRTAHRTGFDLASSGTHSRQRW